MSDVFGASFSALKLDYFHNGKHGKEIRTQKVSQLRGTKRSPGPLDLGCGLMLLLNAHFNPLCTFLRSKKSLY